VNSDNNVLHQSQHIQQKPTTSFKFLKPLTLLGAALFIALVAGTGGYWLGARTHQEPTPIPESQSASIPTIPQPSPTDIIPKQALSTITKKQFNPSGTLAFYFVSEKPSFPQSHDGSEGLCADEDDPFQICYNGDTQYYTPRAAQHRGIENSTFPYIIEPRVLDIEQNKEYAIPSIEVYAAVGRTQITRWINDTHLMMKVCMELSCKYSLIDVPDDSAELLGETGVFHVELKVDPYKDSEYLRRGGTIIENRVRRFVISQYCDGNKNCQEINIFKGVPEGAFFPYASLKPLAIIRTTQEMKLIDFEAAENLSSIKNEVTVHVGGDHFKFDLLRGKVSSSTLVD